MTALCFYAAQQSTEAMGVNHPFNHSVYMSDDTVPLKTKGNSKNKDEKPSNPKSPIMVPEITLDGRTIHFVTPCVGLTFINGKVYSAGKHPVTHEKLTWERVNYDEQFSD